MPNQTASRFLGFSAIDDNPDYTRELRAEMPIDDGDEHVLLFEIHTRQLHVPMDWFHGNRPLQVWIRRSDLDARNFDDVWCQIRTDS